MARITTGTNAISKLIQDILKKRCNRVSELIYNGIFLPEKSRDSDFLKRLGVEPGYMLAVSRIEPCPITGSGLYYCIVVVLYSITMLKPDETTSDADLRSNSLKKKSAWPH